MPKAKSNLLGAWAFLAGVIIAIIVGFLGVAVTSGIWAIILVVIGLIVGLLNVAGKELTHFLLAGVSLVIVSSFGAGSLIAVPYIGQILAALLVLFIPATIVVALRSLFAVAKGWKLFFVFLFFLVRRVLKNSIEKAEYIKF